MDFVKFEAEHFNQLDNATLKVLKHYCYMHKFWIELNLNLYKTCNTTMIKAIVTDWNNE